MILSCILFSIVDNVEQQDKEKKTNHKILHINEREIVILMEKNWMRLRLNHNKSNQVEVVAVVVVLEEDIVNQHYQHIDKHV